MTDEPRDQDTRFLVARGRCHRLHHSTLPRDQQPSPLEREQAPRAFSQPTPPAHSTPPRLQASLPATTLRPRKVRGGRTTTPQCPRGLSSRSLLSGAVALIQPPQPPPLPLGSDLFRAQGTPRREGGATTPTRRSTGEASSAAPAPSRPARSRPRASATRSTTASTRRGRSTRRRAGAARDGTGRSGRRRRSEGPTGGKGWGVRSPRPCRGNHLERKGAVAALLSAAIGSPQPLGGIDRVPRQGFVWLCNRAVLAESTMPTALASLSL
mmetsp:Transcript_29575/g.70449  ORF Transcript_29575/g.70449 Transcript_29575/m.70449 type:complete len:268 (-) Transcript_29575:8-811(-)